MGMKTPGPLLGTLLLLSLASPAAIAQVGATTGPEPINPPTHVEAIPADDGAVDTGLRKAVDDLSAPIRIALLMSLLTLLPGMLLTLTSYTRIIIVLSFVRRAIGAQELPPSPILVGLALFLTGAVMSPTFGRLYDNAVSPYLEQKMTLMAAADAATGELKTFMLRQTREEDLVFALDLAKTPRPADPAATPFHVAVPAFVLSELRTAFRMGFIIFLPFVLIDLVVAAVLLALGMFMLPPTMIAMPLKILLFILVDGWTLILQSLATSFHTT